MHQNTAIRLSSEAMELPPEVMIGEVPCWALDVHTRQGRLAFDRFLKTDARAARWVRNRIKLPRQVSFFGHIVFCVESGLVINRMCWPLADELRRIADFECSTPILTTTLKSSN